MSSSVETLTISFAGVVDPDEVLVAAALVRSLRVVADVGTRSKPLTLILICTTAQGHMGHVTHWGQTVVKAQHKHEKERKCTFTSVVSPSGLEARFAGAEGVSAIHHAVSFVSVSTHRLVAATVVQHCI